MTLFSVAREFRPRYFRRLRFRFCACSACLCFFFFAGSRPLGGSKKENLGREGSGSDRRASRPVLYASMKAFIPAWVVISYPAAWPIAKNDFAMPKFEGSFIIPGKSGSNLRKNSKMASARGR